MTMDLIAGTVILTAVFVAVVGISGLHAGRSADSHVVGSDGQRRGKMVLAVVLIVYFLGVTNVLFITQQYNLAFLNLSVGIALALIQYFSGAAPATSSGAEREAGRGRPRADAAEPARPEREDRAA